MKEAVSRISGSFISPADEEVYGTVVSKSFMFSADVAHAIHPNYSGKHESNHQPVLNKGTVIKTNSNQRYATNSITGFFCRELARQANIGVQEFVVRNDCPCGTTIGPIISGNTGIRTIDVGVCCPLLLEAVLARGMMGERASTAVIPL
jgi:aspartyl aminopeptidase